MQKNYNFTILYVPTFIIVKRSERAKNNILYIWEGCEIYVKKVEFHKTYLL